MPGRAGPAAERAKGQSPRQCVFSALRSPEPFLDQRLRGDSRRAVRAVEATAQSTRDSLTREIHPIHKNRGRSPTPELWRCGGRLDVELLHDGVAHASSFQRRAQHPTCCVNVRTVHEVEKLNSHLSSPVPE